jgi:hypothetical protein
MTRRHCASLMYSRDRMGHEVIIGIRHLCPTRAGGECFSAASLSGTISCPLGTVGRTERSPNIAISHRSHSMFPACPTCGKPMTAEAAYSFRCEPCREIIRFFEVMPSPEFRPHWQSSE